MTATVPIPTVPIPTGIPTPPPAPPEWLPPYRDCGKVHVADDHTTTRDSRGHATNREAAIQP